LLQKNNNNFIYNKNYNKIVILYIWGFYKMKNAFKKIGSISIIICILMLSSVSVSSNNLNINIVDFNIKTASKDTQIHLLRVEHFLNITSSENITDFYVKYVFPPDYSYQTPIMLQVFEDTDPDVINYKIENDEQIPNKFVNFSVAKINISEHKLIHFSAWVLAKNNEFDDLPSTKAFPNKTLLPNQTKKWLVETAATQKDALLIKTRSKIMKIFNQDMVSYSKRVAGFIKDHRYLMFLLQLKLGVFFKQDAKTTYLINGENVGRSHLACAMLRNQNIPARVILANNDQGFWTQMHYMVEYYVPDYGWVLLDTTNGKTPYRTSKQVINRICYPEDENNTKTDYIFKRMKGEERWIWLSNDSVKPYYVDCREGSKSQMFSENVLLTCQLVAEECFIQTKKTFSKYQEFLGENLVGENQSFFENGQNFQNNAITSMQNNDTLGYYYNISRAYEEYNKIQ